MPLPPGPLRAFVQLPHTRASRLSGPVALSAGPGGSGQSCPHGKPRLSAGSGMDPGVSEAPFHRRHVALGLVTFSISRPRAPCLADGHPVPSGQTANQRQMFKQHAALLEYCSGCKAERNPFRNRRFWEGFWGPASWVGIPFEIVDIGGVLGPS